MITLRQEATSQEFRVIPRELIATNMDITDEAQGTKVNILIVPSVDRYYLLIDSIVNLIQGKYYLLIVFNGTTEVYRDRIFCTNQVLANYSVQDGVFVERTTPNTFLERT